MKVLLRRDEIIDRNPEAFERGASEAEVDLAAVAADAGNLPDRCRAFGDDVCADIERGWRRGPRRLRALAGGFFRLAIAVTRAPRSQWGAGRDGTRIRPGAAAASPAAMG